jgi:hypothetical protein
MLSETFGLDFIKKKHFELPPIIYMKFKYGNIFTYNAFWNLQY